MPRRDLLTYDVAHRRRSWWAGAHPGLVVLLIVVLALAVVLVTWTARSGRPTSGSAPPTHVVSAAAVSRRSPSATPRPSASPALIGSDADGSDHAPRGSRTAAARFIAAWLEREPKARRSALQDTAAPGLAEQLMLTSPSNIPKATVKGVPVLEHASAYSAQFLQTLSDGMRVRIYLVADPQARFGWVASSVERA